jgi:putative ABC transport system permease protein
MSREKLNEMLDYDKDFFCGYMSDTAITDINSDYIGQVIDLEALTKVSRQLDVSMGSMMYLVDAFAILIFIVLIYLLSRISIERNAQSISMAKILGYKSGEITRIYLLPTAIVVLCSMGLTIPPVFYIIKWLMKIVMEAGMTGWMEIYISGKTMLKVFTIGAVSYFVVSLLEIRKIRKVPMDEALKNVE